jgi:hypothetical protein
MIRLLCSWVKRNRLTCFFFYFNIHNFSSMQYDEFLNSVLIKILKMNPSFLGFFISTNFKFLKISNGTGGC